MRRITLVRCPELFWTSMMILALLLCAMTVNADPPPACPQCRCKMVAAFKSPTESVAHGMRQNGAVFINGVGNIEAAVGSCPDPVQDLATGSQSVTHVTYTSYFIPECTYSQKVECANLGGTITDQNFATSTYCFEP
jgi:hypothetical protein